MTTRVVGDVAVRVGADVGPLKIGLQDGGRAVDRFGQKSRRNSAALAKNLKHVAVAAAAMGTALVAASRQAISSLDKIGKTADKLGITTDELQELRFAAKSAGIETNTLDMAIQRFTRRAAEAAAGTGEAKAALEEMGISLTDQNGNMRSTTDLLADVADAMKNTGSQADRVRLAFKLFDSEGVSMVNMLQDGSQAFREVTRDARNFGAVVDEEAVRAAEELEDKMGRLGDGIKGQLNEALVELGPLLVVAAEGVLTLARGFNGLVGFVSDTFQALDELLNPLARLEGAHDEVVEAMADEIRQSQQLDAALERGGKMSEATARLKLQEAETRYRNAQAAIEEARAIAQNSDAMKSLNARIDGYREALFSIGGPGAEAEDIPAHRRAAFEEMEEGLSEALKKRDELLKVPEELAEQSERAENNVNRLAEALQNVTNGVVSLDGGGVVSPIETEDGSGGGSTGERSSVGSKDQTALDEMLGLTDEQQKAREERMAGALETQRKFFEDTQTLLEEAREKGLITQEQYNAAEQELQKDHNEKMRALRYEQTATALGATAEMFDGLAQLSSSGGERLLRISKVFSAAQAFVNTMAGAAEALKLPFPANLAAAAKVIATGAGFVSAIKGASAGGGNNPAAAAGGGGGSSIAATAEEDARTIQREITVNLRGGLAGQASGVRDIIQGINEELGDGANLAVNIG